ncbi:restriction endonuclease subunit S [Euhalothece natronophila Z-M001]|uniref:Restriction endonuclease subunit S n=1 Tax=Euhalothece natronophila Z-M001 TaxID=522448 RepID=A0A5B8NNI6_9CHRO|nr:restriction endonuclease subunit S [Euhalothece natronophila]QDZ39815.1 restriction endonuclease subunit S [Euhalothece natronophila Z-M001]
MWKEVSLGEILTIQRGGSPRPITSYLTDSENGINWVKISNTQGISKYIYETQQKIKPEGISKTRVVYSGDFILSNSMSFCKPYIMRTTGCIHDGWLVLRKKETNLDENFLYYILRSDLIYKQFKRLASGTTVKNLNINVVKKVQIPLPPLEEQKRIAEILDRADAIRQKRKGVIALTEELARSTFLEMFGDPTTNSKGWNLKSLGELAKISGGGTPSKKCPQYYEGNICWVTSKDMNVHMLVDTKNHITEKAIEDSSTKLVGIGTLLVVVKSKILMKRLPVVRTKVPTCFNQDIKAIELYDSWMTRYCHWHMKLGQDTLLNKARGLNTEGLTLEHFNNYQIMIPTYSEIMRFTKVEKTIEESLLASRQALENANNLFNSLLQRAFKGEL